MPEQSYPPDLSISTAIEALLRAALPDHPTLIEGLSIKVAERPDLAHHAGKQWGELSEGEQNLVAREVGLMAAVATQPLDGGKH